MQDTNQNTIQPAMPVASPAPVQAVNPALAPVQNSVTSAPVVPASPDLGKATALVNPVPENQPEVSLEKKPAPRQFKIIPNLEDLLRDEEV